MVQWSTGILAVVAGTSKTHRNKRAVKISTGKLLIENVVWVRFENINIQVPTHPFTLRLIFPLLDNEKKTKYE